MPPPQNSHSHATADVINGNDVRGLKNIPDVSFRNGLSDSTGDGVGGGGVGEKRKSRQVLMRAGYLLNQITINVLIYYFSIALLPNYYYYCCCCFAQ